MMRSYPVNSPQAAARIVTLAMLADGRLGNEELLVLDYVRAHEILGLSVPQLNAVMTAFRQDLDVSPHPGWADAGLVDSRTMAELMAEIEEPALRRQVLQLCVAVVEADGRVHESEAVVLNAAVEHWGLHRAMFQRHTALRPG
jgi:tellurite resistance protein